MWRNTATPLITITIKRIVIMTGVKCKTAAQKSEGGKVNVRVMKVSYACRYHDFVQMPAIRIQGLWLEAIGFTVGAEMEVRVMDGCIVLMVRKIPDGNEVLEQVMRKVRALPPERQVQIREMVGVLEAG